MVGLKRHWPLAISLAVFWAMVATLLLFSLQGTEGQLVYALDDPYIHMAMAKNLVRHGSWGVNADGFSSSSSSPLWTLLLSLVFLLFGVNQIGPLALNVLFGSLLILSVYQFLRRYSLRPRFMFIALLAMIHFAPLPRLVLLGQEHIMHAFLTLWLMSLLASALSREEVTVRFPVLFFILASLTAMARYEGLFLILAICALLLLRKRPGLAVFLGFAGLLPALVYGAVSLSKGWFFLPNPVLLKGGLPGFPEGFSLPAVIDFIGLSAGSAYRMMMRYPHVLFLILGALVLIILLAARNQTERSGIETMLGIFLTTSLFHLSFAKVDASFRYEAYLVALGVTLFALGLHAYLSAGDRHAPRQSRAASGLAIGLLALILLLPFEVRAWYSLKTTPQAAKNIYQQQVQMGLFLRQYYQGRSVVANDIGAINFLAEIDCVDLYGLGTVESARMLRSGQYDTRQISDLALKRGARIAVVYERAYDKFGGLPRGWLKVGQWRIADNIACADDVVSFYAPDRQETLPLIENLREFASRLPEGVDHMVAKIEADVP